MSGEIDLYGVFLPSLLVWMVIAFLLNVSVRSTLSLLGFYKYVWHRPLFDIALYVVLLGIVVEIASFLT
jgi:hypothetical protein